ncbi:hypothetical protein [Streptomyces sp. NPDC048659]|uniref:hypothetical protein n=1 Tax=Streptomyces sp. NPDC048659 TaxID=3155489 RepID=UPI00341323C2
MRRDVGWGVNGDTGWVRRDPGWGLHDTGWGIVPAPRDPEWGVAADRGRDD